MIIINGVLINCDGCRFYKDGVCNNDNSIYATDEMDKDQACGEWEGADNDI